MAKPKVIEVFRKVVSLTATGGTRVDVPRDNMPSGLIHKFIVRLESAACTGLTAADANFQQVLQSITYGAATPKFQPMSGIRGLAWDRYYSTMALRAPKRVTPTAADGFVATYHLPFSWEGAGFQPAYRPKDTGLLNLKNQASPYLNLILGAFTDLGDATACDVTVIVKAVYEEAPQAGFDPTGGDQPGAMLEISMTEKSDISNNPIANLLQGGARSCLMLGIRELDDTGAEQSDIFNVTPGDGNNSKIDIVRGPSDNFTPRMTIASLDADMEDHLKNDLPAGLHVWFASLKGAGVDAVPLNDTFRLISDKLATTNQRVWEILQVNTILNDAETLKTHATWFAQP